MPPPGSTAGWRRRQPGRPSRRFRGICAANSEHLAPVFNRDFLKSLEILLDVGPLEIVIGFRQPAVQFLAQDQGQEAAEDMNPDGFIQLMENLGRVENWLRLL